MKTSTSQCKNPTGCRYAAICTLRQEGLDNSFPRSSVVAAWSNEIEAADGEASAASASSFEIENGIGRFTISGNLDPGLFSILDRVEAALARCLIRGLFILIDCSGGGWGTSMRVQEVIGRARLFIPVVCHSDFLAISGGFLALISGHHVSAGGGCVLGSFGCAIHLCSRGEKPFWMTCSQAARKWDGEPASSPTGFFDGDRGMLQATMDDVYEDSLRLVSLFRGVSGNDVRGILDGRLFLSTTALRAKLLDAIIDEPTAYSKLLSMI